MKKLIIPFLIVSFLSGCGSKAREFIIKPQDNVKIRVSGLKHLKSRKEIIGFVQIENQSENFVRLSNRELFLFYGSDSARAFVKMPGEFEIDKGLINIPKGKIVNYQVHWQIEEFSWDKDVKVKYVTFLDRENK